MHLVIIVVNNALLAAVWFNEAEATDADRTSWCPAAKTRGTLVFNTTYSASGKFGVLTREIVHKTHGKLYYTSALKYWLMVMSSEHIVV